MQLPFKTSIVKFVFFKELSIHVGIIGQITPILDVFDAMQLLAECMDTNFIKYVMLLRYRCLIFLFVLLVGVLAIANLYELHNLKACRNKICS